MNKVVACRLLGLALALGAQLAADLDALEDALTVLVQLELVDDDVAGVDAQGNRLARDLLAGDTLDVDDVLETVDGGDLALAALVGSADDGDLVVLSHGDAADLLGSNCVRGICSVQRQERMAERRPAYVVLLTELLAQRCAHDVAADARRGAEVSLPRLASGAVESCSRERSKKSAIDGFHDVLDVGVDLVRAYLRSPWPWLRFCCRDLVVSRIDCRG
jgi:hypothetical protein